MKPPGLQFGLQLHVLGGPSVAHVAGPGVTHRPPAFAQSCGVPYEGDDEDEAHPAATTVPATTTIHARQPIS